MMKSKRPARPPIVLLSEIALSLYYFVILFVLGCLVFMLNGCKNIPVFDKEVCADLGTAGAHCAFILANPPRRRDIERPAWDKERIGWVCMRADDFSDAEDSIESLCRSTNLCIYQTKAQLEQLKKNVAPIILKARESARAAKPLPCMKNARFNSTTRKVEGDECNFAN